MGGLDKIVEEIHKQAEAEAAAIFDKADEYCNAYMDEVKEAVQKEVDQIRRKASEERELLKEKTRSGSEFKERNEILKARQQCINDVVYKALQTIKNLPTDEYFQLLQKILKANIGSADGIMRLGKRDLDRMTPDFERMVCQIADENNCRLEISKEPSDIDSGFVLVYGEIEENCTLDAMYNANIDRLKDVANRELFS